MEQKNPKKQNTIPNKRICVFCQMPLFGNGEAVKVTKCAHIFHENCFEEALNK